MSEVATIPRQDKLFFAAVAGALVLVFVRFTGSTMLAVGLVVGMVAYMAVMGHLAAKK